jgi:radical SAM superfamily enzyme YgiQ (UPF0313 family)
VKFLLINPYICDFACYDYWLKPLGLLYLSALLKEKGHSVDLIDCMDRHHPALPETKDRKYGVGSYFHYNIPRPGVLDKYPRNYSKYGLSGEKLHRLLEDREVPDMVLITSTMTYWYTGVKEVADMVKNVFPDVPIVLGGNYATLCREHAENNIKADHIITGNDFKEFFSLINEDVDDFSGWPAPDYSSYGKVPYAVLRTSVGCPRQCSYCGIKSIAKKFIKKTSEKIRTEINFLKNKYNVRDVVFYDDSLFANEHFIEYLESLPERLRFHTPNGIEVRKIDKKIAQLLKNADFISPCLSVDIVSEMRMNSSGGKLKKNNIEEAVEYMFRAGYRPGEISSYLIMGLPGQSLDEVRDSVKYLHKLGLKINLAEYAVVPDTSDASSFDAEILKEPLLHNNSVFPSFALEDWDEIFEIKSYTKYLNDKFQKGKQNSSCAYKYANK